MRSGRGFGAVLAPATPLDPLGSRPTALLFEGSGVASARRRRAYSGNRTRHIVEKSKWNRGQRRSLCRFACGLFSLVPPCTALIAQPLFGKRLGPVALVGMALTAVGVALASRGAAR